MTMMKIKYKTTHLLRGNVVAGCPHVNLLIDIKAGDDEEHLVDDNDGGDGDDQEGKAEM